MGPTAATSRVRHARGFPRGEWSRVRMSGANRLPLRFKRFSLTESLRSSTKFRTFSTPNLDAISQNSLEFSTCECIIAVARR